MYSVSGAMRLHMSNYNTIEFKDEFKEGQGYPSTTNEETWKNVEIHKQ